MQLPIVNTWISFVKVFLGILDFDFVIALIERHLPHIIIEETEGFILAQELRLRKYNMFNSSSNSFVPFVNLTQASSLHSTEIDSSNQYSGKGIL